MTELTLRKEIITDKTLCRIVGVGVFVLLTALGAFVRIPLPFTPVPVTLQTFFVLLAGAFLGAKGGVLSQVIYIVMGIIGFPFFNGAQGGLYYFLGPTTGYMIGFVITALFISRNIDSYAKNFFMVFALFVAGDILLLGCGTLWLRAYLRLSFFQSLWMGFIPFIFGDILKAFLAAGLYSKLKTRLREIF